MLLNSFFILSQKHIMGVKKVVWCGSDVVWGGLVVVWGGLGWFGVFPRTVFNLIRTFSVIWKGKSSYLFFNSCFQDEMIITMN